MADQRSTGKSPQTAFEWVDGKHQFLLDTTSQFLEQPTRQQISRYLYLAHQIQQVCATHSDGIMAALILNRTPLYAYVKELFAGVLCEMLGQRSAMSSPQRLRLICAALTQDVAIQEIQQKSLKHQSGPLNDGQKRAVERHPQAVRRLLMQAGVDDPTWLDAVEQHHERTDGKGYPQGLKDQEICLPARILATADCFAAMLRPRGDRPAKNPTQAIKAIFQLRGEQIDVTQAKNLTDLFGIHPLGSWVKLANGEVGVVSRSGKQHAFPLVTSMITDDDEPLFEPQIRDSSIRQFTIIETTTAPFHPGLGGILASIWDPIPA